MYKMKAVRTATGIASWLTAAMFLASCNSGPVLTPVETKTHPLVGSKSGDLKFVRSLSPPEHVRVGQSQLIFRNDLLDIDVFQVDELDRQVRVDTNGMISMPLIGPVNAAGRTVPELEHTLKARYGKNYLQSPEISVFVKESSGQAIVVSGPVKRPGTYPVSSQSTLLRLLAQAGGLTELADEKKLFVYRKHGKENHVAQFSVQNIRKGLNNNPKLYAGDIVVALPSDSKIAMKNLKEALGLASSAARVAIPF